MAWGQNMYRDSLPFSVSACDANRLQAAEERAANGKGKYKFRYKNGKPNKKEYQRWMTDSGICGSRQKELLKELDS